MRALIIGILGGWMAAAPAVADVATLRFVDGHGLDGWKAEHAEGWKVADGVMVQTAPNSFARAVPLDANGWAVEVKLAMTGDAMVRMTFTDDRLTTTFVRGKTSVSLDGDSLFLVDGADELEHTYRIEASTGRRLLIMDGHVILDVDQALPAMALAPDPKVTFGTVQNMAPNNLARWRSLTIDTAPTGLAMSSQPFVAPLRFTGTFAPWLYQVALRMPEAAQALSQIQLSERARGCVAFELVAAISAKRPKHFRARELQKLPKPTRSDQSDQIVPPQIDFDLLEMPAKHKREARVPMFRPRRVAADLRAQDELGKALAAKDPLPFYERAVTIAVTEGSLPREGLAWLVATLPELEKHPDACR